MLRPGLSNSESRWCHWHISRTIKESYFLHPPLGCQTNSFLPTILHLLGALWAFGWVVAHISWIRQSCLRSLRGTPRIVGISLLWLHPCCTWASDSIWGNTLGLWPWVCFLVRWGQSRWNPWRVHPDAVFSWKQRLPSLALDLTEAWVYCVSWWFCWHTLFFFFYLGLKVTKAEFALCLPALPKNANKAHACSPQMSALVTKVAQHVFKCLPNNSL